MDLLPVLSYTIGIPAAGYFALAAARLHVGSARTVAALRRAGTQPPPPASGTPPVRFAVLMPMLREDRVVDRACAHLAGAIRAGVPLEVVIAVSEREEHERSRAVEALRRAAGQRRSEGLDEALTRAVRPEAHPRVRAALATGDEAALGRILAAEPRPTTAEAAAEVADRLNAELGRTAFRLVTAPASAGGKVGQLNAALRAWSDRRGADRSTVYVGVYDADSQPDLAVFDRMSGQVAVRGAQGAAAPEIFQQVSCYCRNLGDMRGLRAALALPDALAQTRWALGFEYELYRRYSARARRGTLRPLAYCIGHGCFVSADFLERIGGFPTLSPNDDLALGYQASLLGAEIAPVPALDYCDVAPDSLSTIRQSRFWFHGSARFDTDLRAFRAELGVRPGRLQWWALLAAGHGRNLAWAWRAALWTVAALLAAVAGQPALLAVLLALHLWYVQGGYLQTLRQLRRLPGGADRSGVGRLPLRLLAAGAVAASAAFVIRSLGPLTGSLQLLARRRPTRPWKVER
ncbi:hypothetical protein ACGF07_11240 [Kitasatospora sp. NPDC048194]|uniref:hypothetical protein n=1 Tax=Kitasatospora sp. NPDC048194 TaxID=3364045 RepID=UPI0037191A0E